MLIFARVMKRVAACDCCLSVCVCVSVYVCVWCVWFVYVLYVRGVYVRENNKLCTCTRTSTAYLLLRLLKLLIKNPLVC